MLRYLLALMLAIPLCAATPSVATKQRLEAISEAAQLFLDKQLATYGDRARYNLGKLDGRLTLNHCDKLEVQLPTGNRLLGNTSLRVQCAAGAKWAVNLPVAISIDSDFWVAARALAPNYEINENDLEKRSGDLSQLPAGVITDAALAIGRSTIGGIPAGMPVRTDQLRPAYSVRANDQVRVIARGDGFEVATEGRAMGNASEGQQVSVKLVSGAVVKGLAKPGGLVEIVY